MLIYWCLCDSKLSDSCLLGHSGLIAIPQSQLSATILWLKPLTKTIVDKVNLAERHFQMQTLQISKQKDFSQYKMQGKH